MQPPIHDQVLALRIVRAIARRNGQALLTLHDLSDELRVERRDVRRVVSKLHTEGFVDALHMRLTMQGRALAAMLGRRSPARATRRPAPIAAGFGPHAPGRVCPTV
ncbi:MAG: hypothetical protein ACOC1F_11530 [Myxococcota bacterium]